MIPNIYCLMNSGKPLNNRIREVLLINAVDMAETGREEQRVQSGGYTGVIKSSLESILYVGMSCVCFDAEIECNKLGLVKVRYLVRVQDINEGVLALGKWSTLGEIMEEMGIEPPDDESWKYN